MKEGLLINKYSSESVGIMCSTSTIVVCYYYSEYTGGTLYIAGNVQDSFFNRCCKY